MRSTRFISYLRVSTAMQGQSGLGIEAQRLAVAQFAAANGLEAVAEYVEVQSGKGSDARSTRPQLGLAMAQAKASGCAIVVAKLDRLSRNSVFIGTLIEEKVEFYACDIGTQAGPLELQMRASFAEEERRAISARTKAALAAKKARGGRLGTLDPAKLSAAGGKGLSDAADAFARDVIGRVRRIQAALPGASMRALAAAMNEDRIPSMRGAPWSGVTLANVIARAESLS